MVYNEYKKKSESPEPVQILFKLSAYKYKNIKFIASLGISMQNVSQIMPLNAAKLISQTSLVMLLVSVLFVILLVLENNNNTITYFKNMELISLQRWWC